MFFITKQLINNNIKKISQNFGLFPEEAKFSSKKKSFES
jgi:hypothetical protein